jgi:hypothetical protein
VRNILFGIETPCIVYAVPYYHRPSYWSCLPVNNETTSALCSTVVAAIAVAAIAVAAIAVAAIAEAAIAAAIAIEVEVEVAAATAGF